MYPPFNKLSNFNYKFNCKHCALSWFSEGVVFTCPSCSDSNLEYTKSSNENSSINKKDLKNALVELFQTGEIKVQVNYEDIWQELHVAIDIDNVEVYYRSTPIVFKAEYD